MATSPSNSNPAGRFIGICAAFAVFAVVGIYSSRMAYHTTGYDDDQAQERYAKLAKLQADDQKTLTTADWIDQAKGTVRIPIDEAMIQEVALLKAKPVQIGTALPAPAPAATSTNASPSINAVPAGKAPATPTPTPTPAAKAPAEKPPAGKAPPAKAKTNK